MQRCAPRAGVREAQVARPDSRGARRPLASAGSALALALLLLAACADETAGDAAGRNGGTAPGQKATGGAGTAGENAPPTSPSGADATGRGDGGSNGASTTTCGGQPLTQWEQMMLDKHNEWRAAVLPAAAEMKRVRWDTNIAKNAASWIASCDPDWPHSPVETRSNIGGYDVLGENLSMCTVGVCSDLPRVQDGSGLGDGEGWWEERKDYTFATDTSTGLTTHYTQMVSSNVYAIGCATKKCGAPGPDGWKGEWWWTACQYGPRGQAYFVGNRPYTAGAGGLVEPPESVFTQHPGLCR